MPPSVTKKEAGLTVVQRLPSSPARVWDALTDPRHLTGWFAPMDTWGCRVDHLDLRVGGAYAVEMIEPDGTVHRIQGTYRAVDAPRRLAFSWKWAEEPAEAAESLVEITLSPEGDGTRLELRHTRMAGSESVESHAKGWIGCLTRLESYVERLGSETHE